MDNPPIDALLAELKALQLLEGKAGSRRPQDELATRWDQLREAAISGIPAGSELSMSEIALAYGLTWYATRGADLLGDYLSLSGAELMASPGFGKKKMVRLASFLEIMLQDRGVMLPLRENAGEGKMTDPIQTLSSWGVPLDFPCHLLALPVRVLGYCEENHVHLLGELLGLWNSLGYEGFKSQRNLGTRSVRILGDFVGSLRKQDFAAAQNFLPLCDRAQGLSLPRGIQFAVNQLTTSEREVIERRLVGRMTLEESAEIRAITRERVRQVESNFIEAIKQWFGWFEVEYEALLTEWTESRDWFRAFLPWPSAEEDAILARAAIESIFQDTPQGTALRLMKEELFDSCSELLSQDPALHIEGVRLAEFVADHVPTDLQDDFCIHLSGIANFRIDHARGTIHPQRTSLRKTVRALLDLEEDPVPLTWLVQLVSTVPEFTLVGEQELRSQRSRWRQLERDIAERIIWDQ